MRIADAGYCVRAVKSVLRADEVTFRCNPCTRSETRIILRGDS
jgi:hypothetical protein